MTLRVYIQRTTKEIRNYDLHEKQPDPLELSSWIRDPDLSEVTGEPLEYWEINGDLVTLKGPKKRKRIRFEKQIIKGNRLINNWVADNDIDDWTPQEKFDEIYGSEVLKGIVATQTGCFTGAKYGMGLLTPTAKMTQPIIDDFIAKLDVLIGA